MDPKAQADPSRESHSGARDEISLADCLNGIGFGKYQLKIFLMVGLVLVADGAEMVCLTAIQETLKRSPPPSLRPPTILRWYATAMCCYILKFAGSGS